jgi:putative phage-type endonuclease
VIAPNDYHERFSEQDWSVPEKPAPARAFTVCTAPQRSPEWFAARLGRVTGSRAADVLATIKSGEAAARRDYRMDLVTERLTRQPADADGFVSADMQRGVELEAEARAAYEADTGVLVDQTGFLAHADLMVGCSLDGHVGDFAGIIEIKCPRSANHLAAVRAGGVPSKYLPQITHNLWVTGAAWCDFVSYDPRFPYALRLYVARIEASALDLAGYEKKVRAFLAEVDAETEAVAGYLRKRAAEAA